MQGLSELHIPLLDGSEEGTYKVRMGFTAHPGQARGQRIFDVHLQDQPVAEAFDVLAEATGPREAVIKEFAGIKVQDELHVRFTSRSSSAALNQSPMIQFLEITREDKAPKKVGFLNPVH